MRRNDIRQSDRFGQKYSGTAFHDAVARNTMMAARMKNASTHQHAIEVRSRAALQGLSPIEVSRYLAQIRAADAIVLSRPAAQALAQLAALTNYITTAMGLDLATYWAAVEAVTGLRPSAPVPAIVTFSLDGTTPPAGNVSVGSLDNDIAHIGVVPVPYVPAITSIAVTRTGASVDADFGNIYLVAPDASVLTAVLVAGVATFTPVGNAQAGVWQVHCDIAPGATPGNTFRLEILLSTDIVPAAVTTTVAGTFPISSSVFTIIP